MSREQYIRVVKPVVNIKLKYDFDQMTFWRQCVLASMEGGTNESTAIWQADLALQAMIDRENERVG